MSTAPVPKEVKGFEVVPLTEVGLRGGVDLVVDVRRIVKTLLTIITCLVITGSSANIISRQVAPSPQHKLAKLMNRFDICFEPSIPGWYSSMALLGSSILLAVITVAKWKVADRDRRYWLVLSALFLGLSIDEGVRFHEMIHTVMVAIREWHGLLYFPWVIPAFIFVTVVGLSYVPFLRRIDPRTAVLFVAAGGVYVFGAVGMDMIGGMIVEKHGILSLQHSICETIEETLEMLGILFFNYALLDYIRRCIGPIRLCLESSSVPRPSVASVEVGLAGNAISH